MKEKTLRIPGLWLLWLIVIAAFGIAIFSISSMDMAREWLRDEGGYVFSWWLLTTLVAVAVFPLMFRLLGSLADRGYTLARSAGLLLTGVIFWFLASVGLLRNDPGAMIFAWLIVIFLSALAWINWPNRPSMNEIRQWASENLPVIVITEALFLVAFVAWAYVQAHNPEITSTEKPMEMAFINGVRNSATFPPKDPWLSGYAISYYYFGYVLTASLADLSGVTTGIAFNLIDALLFALTATGAFGIAYNLVRSAGPLSRWRVGNRNAALGTGLLAATLVVMIGNLGTLLVELPYKGYTAGDPLLDNIVSDKYFDFWDVRERSGPYYLVHETQEIIDGEVVIERRIELLDTGEILPPGAPIPDGYIAAPDRPESDGVSDGIPDWDDPDTREFHGSYDFWWWFRYSRVVHDRDLSGNSIGAQQPIAEVPQFSFILADNHPHVLGLPFTLLMIGLAMALVFRAEPLARWEMVLYGVLVGGMIFTNAWDAVYLVVIVMAEALRRLLRNGTGRLNGWSHFVDIVTLQRRVQYNLILVGPVFGALLVYILLKNFAAFDTYWWVNLGIQIMVAAVLTLPATLIVNWLLDDNDWAGILRLGVVLFLVFYVFYYPWISSFTSQANGFFPNIIHPTATQQSFLQFGIFGLLIAPFLLMEVWQARRRLDWGAVSLVVMIGMALLLFVPVFSALFINWQCPTVGEKPGQIERFAEWSCEARSALLGGGYDSESSGALAGDVLERRLSAGISEILMLLAIGIVLMRLFGRVPRHQKREENQHPLNFSPNTGVALLIIAGGVMAALLPDLVYLRDNFSNRMNTVFKLYYQAWVMLSVGAAYAVYAVLRGTESLHVESRRPINLLSLAVRWLVYGNLVLMLLGAGLLYPYYAIPQRFLLETGRDDARACVQASRVECIDERPLTLDGSDTLVARITLDDYTAIQCLNELEPYKSDAVLVEMYGGAYDPHLGRFSMFTGIPTLLGWTNHEHQWRGFENFVQVIGGRQREQDIDLLYRVSSSEWSQAEAIIRRYSIDYIVVGTTEIRNYAPDGSLTPGLSKFAELLDPVCESGPVAVYRVSPE